MLRTLTLALVPAALLACTGPSDPAQPLSGVWLLDSSTAGVPPRQLTLMQTGTSITGTGTAMGVDVPIPISVTGTYTRATAGPALVNLEFTFENGGGIKASYAGSLSSTGLLVGAVTYYGITSAPISGQLSFRRLPPPDTLPHDSTATGLEGTVTRGPITPVCQAGVPCYAPFSAGFTVTQGQRLVASFQSDSAGRYQVFLAPGTYAITPDSTAPVFPKGQSRTATVGPVGMTQLDLQFDTGIR